MIDIAPQQAAQLYGISNTLATLAGIFGNLSTGWIWQVTGAAPCVPLVPCVVPLVPYVVPLLPCVLPLVPCVLPPLATLAGIFGNLSTGRIWQVTGAAPCLSF